MIRLRMAARLLPALALAGCETPGGWYKDGGSATVFYQDRAICEQRAAAMFPPNYYAPQPQAIPLPQQATETVCRPSYGGQITCVSQPTGPNLSIYGNMLAQAPRPQDLNARQRDAALGSCLQGFGYYWRQR